jgi:aminoglycoside phosphotransferase (APT) family kinase protein
VNAIFRIGDGLAARLPLRDGDPAEVAASLRQEAAAATTLAEHSPFPVPRPVAIGTPGLGYPLPWSVQTWLGSLPWPDRDSCNRLTMRAEPGCTVLREA